MSPAMWLDRFRLGHAHAAAVAIPADYQPRATRFRLELPISFTADGSTQEGQCVNVSHSGLLSTFEKLPELWTAGVLSLEAGGHYLSIHARVARIQGSDVGFAFSIEDENDRAAIGILIDAAAGYPVMEGDLSQ